MVVGVLLSGNNYDWNSKNKDYWLTALWYNALLTFDIVCAIIEKDRI